MILSIENTYKHPIKTKNEWRSIQVDAWLLGKLKLDVNKSKKYSNNVWANRNFEMLSLTPPSTMRCWKSRFWFFENIFEHITIMDCLKIPRWVHPISQFGFIHPFAISTKKIHDTNVWGHFSEMEFEEAIS